MCTAHTGFDLTGAGRVPSCKQSALSCLPPGATQEQCCDGCTKDSACKAWIYDPKAKNCWLMTGGSLVPAADRVAGGTHVSPAGNVPKPTNIKVTVKSKASGATMWHTDDLDSVSQNLNWPSPHNATVYAIKDFPRFYTPPWGPTPIPEGVSVAPELQQTNGYDFRNDQTGDTYLFLIDKDISAWHASRQEFVKLAGPTPVLPDFAFGTWFTFWDTYTEKQAKSEVMRWKDDTLPLDVWALDMNWRNSKTAHGKNFINCPNTGLPGPDDNCTSQDHYYDYPDCDLFPDFCGADGSAGGTGWFDWLKSQGLRTYFNDHPFPTDNGTALQTSPEEVAFRHQGLTKWLKNGLTYWWFDANWAFSIPPPNVHYEGSGDGSDWEGMSNRVWGSHVYYETVRVFNDNNPDRMHTASMKRGMALTKYADANMHPGLVQHQHPAQHRYPVWWTGDGVDLEASVESMVDSGLYDFKPYVHSDCGGDYHPKTGGDLLRWTGHCAFGSIFRYHGSDHRPWTYDNHTEDVIRSYLNMRYKQLPSLISAGHNAAQTAFPIVARCDFYWDAPEATSNHQYVFLNDTLVAPIWNDDRQHDGVNVSSRTVWIPPGSWTDAWSGESVTGPKSINVSQPVEHIPLWHKAGGLTILASEPTLRVDEQDWSELTLEAYPHATDDAAATTETHRVLVDDRSSAEARTTVTMQTDHANGQLRFDISAAEDGAARAWILRVHLAPGQQVAEALLDDLPAGAVVHLSPIATTDADGYVPFMGKGARPPPLAGSIAEIALPSASTPRTVRLSLE